MAAPAAPIRPTVAGSTGATAATAERAPGGTASGDAAPSTAPAEGATTRRAAAATPAGIRAGADAPVVRVESAAQPAVATEGARGAEPQPAPATTSPASAATSAAGAVSVAAPQPPVPAAAPTSAAAASAAATPAHHTATLGTQLARPVFTLAAAGAGEHVMTVHVTPDTLGPVTVRAHVGAEGVRVELFAPTDAGRDALRAILPDLRRDLNGAGLSGSLDLSSQNQPSPQQDPSHRGPDGRLPTAPDAPGGRARAAATGEHLSSAAGRAVPADGLAHTIDLIV